jgi:hypothetical protein
MKTNEPTNSDYLLLFELASKNLKYTYSDQELADMEKEEINRRKQEKSRNS